ncbi:methyltransferase, FkbM family [[Eubacterium] siraeum DSM 15702]|uniref:Methyltransferase, FkbM family n=1 Tax=[Eubacterium] siraeum DSM 15702 TaxID=428128 RepID=B0MS88_9FIRM|nr:methyltransferase, FkbM family [[Eubacterium] siraeum DSM 15702]UWP26087.1 FkbM family methyltransferase [[Eubacterium] siraeum]
MSKLSDKLAGFFGRLFPMSRNKTIKLNNEIRQTESEHFAQLCEMLGFLENSLNTCTDICRDNAEQIKLCRQSLRTLEDNQVKFGESTASKLKEIKLDIENLKKQNECISEKLSNEISEKSAGISGELIGCISHHTEEILGCMTDSDKRSYDSDKHIVELIENGISENHKHAGEIKAFNNSLSGDIKSLSDSVTAGFDKTSKTGEYVSVFDSLSTDNESISADIKSLSDSVTAGFDKTSKTGEYVSVLNGLSADNESISADIKSLSDSVTAGFDKTSKTGEYADILNGLSADNESISADIKSLSDSVTAGFDKTSKTGEYVSVLDGLSADNESISADIKSLSDSVTAGFDKTSKTGEYADTLNGLSADNESISADIKSLSDSVTAGFDKTSKTGEYAQSLLDAENTANTIRREMNLFKRQSYLRKLYFHPGEREALAKLFSDAMNREDSAQRFSALISGLDNESRNTVSDIIHRMGMIADGNKSLQDVYTQREQEEFVRMNDEFSSKIVKLNDNLYYYNGYYLPVNQFDSSVFFTRYGIDKLTTLDSVRNKHIIDAGGYVGDTALLFSSYTDKDIHVFEASPSNMDIIRETIRLNHLDNIVPVSKALGEKSGTATFSLGERNSCNSLVERPGYNYPDHIEVPVVTLDDYVRENDLEVGLIKVDIEGGEQLLLRGAVETIRTQHPILLISIYHSANDFFEIKPMIEKMCGKYTFRIVKPANPAIALETILLAEVRDESGENIINS